MLYLVSKYINIIVHRKAIWAGLICCTHQCYCDCQTPNGVFGISRVGLFVSHLCFPTSSQHWSKLPQYSDWWLLLQSQLMFQVSGGIAGEGETAWYQQRSRQHHKHSSYQCRDHRHHRQTARLAATFVTSRGSRSHSKLYEHCQSSADHPYSGGLTC